MKTKLNYFTILTILSLIATIALPYISQDINNIITAGLITTILASIFSIIAIIFAKKTEKSIILPILLLLISIIASLLFFLLFGLKLFANDSKHNAELCQTLKTCELGDEISTCYLETDDKKLFPIKCKTSNLEQ